MSMERSMPGCPGAPRQAPSTLKRERPPLVAPQAPPNVLPCTIPNPLFPQQQVFAGVLARPSGDTQLPLMRHEERFKFIQRFSTAPFLLQPRERRFRGHC